MPERKTYKITRAFFAEVCFEWKCPRCEKDNEERVRSFMAIKPKDHECICQFCGELVFVLEPSK